MKVLDRVDSLGYINDMLLNNQRVVVSRYSDGEYLMMNSMSNNTHDSFDILPRLLKKSIKAKGQFVCINYLKPHNIERQDNWCTVQKYLSEVGDHGVYGCCNWNIYDFQNDNVVLPILFSGKVLLVTSHIIESRLAFKEIQPDLEVYAMPNKNASDRYEETKTDLIRLCGDNKFDNILFACGPIGKILLTDLIDVCTSNIVDLGALLNAILNEYSQGSPLIGKWTMSWVKSVDVKKCAEDFFVKLEKLGGQCGYI